MAEYAVLARDAGVRIIGGCCGTMPEHLRAMRDALESRPKGPRPTLEDITRQAGRVLLGLGRHRRRCSGDPSANGAGGAARTRKSRHSPDFARVSTKGLIGIALRTGSTDPPPAAARANRSQRRGGRSAASPSRATPREPLRHQIGPEPFAAHPLAKPGHSRARHAPRAPAPSPWRRGPAPAPPASR